jgi:hypothetical protein
LQHFAVHELEAWLLAEPKGFPERVRKALPGKCSKPETINFNEPPAKLLDKLYKAKLKKGYRKIVDGVDLFSKLDPTTACEKCPQFRALLNDLLRLSKEAGL